MTVKYLTNNLSIVEGSWDSVFDTRAENHFLRPYFGRITFNSLRMYLNVLYRKYNYMNERYNLFDSQVRETGFLDWIYQEDFIDDYAWTLAFLGASDDEEAFYVLSPDEEGQWTEHIIPMVFVDGLSICVETFQAVKDSLIQNVINKVDGSVGYNRTTNYTNLPLCDTAPIYAWLMFIENEPVIYDAEASQYISPSAFATYPGSYELTYELFGEKRCSESADGIDRTMLNQIYCYSTPATRIFGKNIVKYKRKRKNKKYVAKGPSYGVELELSCNHPTEFMVASQEVPFFMLKSDASITGAYNGHYELVTRPMDYRAQRVAWGKWFAAIWDAEENGYKGFDCTKDTDNGMHVHVGRSSFYSPQHLRRFLWFFVDPANHEFLKFVSERGKKWSRYCEFPTNFSQSRKKDYKNVENLLHDFSTRGAIYPTSKSTIEVRIFKGLVSYATVLKNIEFIDSVFYFTQEANYCNLTASGYMKWLKKTPTNKYKALKTFLDHLPADILSNCCFDIMFHGCLRAVDALRVLDKKSIPPDQKTLVYLNERFSSGGVKAFIIKDGRYILNPVNYALLKDLDNKMNPFEKPLETEPAQEEQPQAHSLTRLYRNRAPNSFPYSVTFYRTST